MIEALETLTRHAASGPQQAMHGALVRRLRDGLRLSEALREQPAVFPALLVALVQASELTSDLPQALARYLAHQRQTAELRHRVTSVAIYPALVTLVGGLVLLFLAFYVMPRFARIFDGMQGELPWSARAMVAWSHGVAAHGVGLLGLLVAVILAVGMAWLSGRVQAWALRVLMGWAPVRRYLRTYFLAQWYRAQGMLLEGGIPLPEALVLANGLLPQAMHAGGMAVSAAVREGASPADALQQGGMATPVAEQLMRAGERTGDLGAVLNRTAAFHEAELTRELERTMRLLEPVVMTLVGLGVGIVVVLMYLPIFELASALQ